MTTEPTRYRFNTENILEMLLDRSGDWDRDLDAWVNVKLDRTEGPVPNAATVTLNPTLGEDEDSDPDADLRERFRVTVEWIDSEGGAL